MRRPLLLLVLLASCSKLVDLQDVTYDPPAPTCRDGQQNGSETAVDCGGSCGPCATGQACESGRDCTTRSCQGMMCQAAGCTDGVENGDETDIDCGGSCDPCGAGNACAMSQDCSSGVCQSKLCVAANCMDDTRNSDETDVDCGGSCAPCATGKDCGAGKDCSSGVCTSSRCQAASCTDLLKNGNETDVDCGGSCGPCSAGKACKDTADCTSQVCVNSLCQAPTCMDSVKNGTETDVDCGGGACAPCAVGKACAADTDCAAAGICDTLLCRVARSCAEILQHIPGSRDGAYSIAPTGVATPFSVVCDMTRDNGGWTLLLKASGDATLNYNASFWTDASLLNATDLTTQVGNTKYQSFLSLPVTTLRGELDGFRYIQTFANMTARQIFAGPADIVNSYPTFNTGAPNWSTQPNCHTFGVNIPYASVARFGWSANQENDCLTNDTAIGLGLNARGAGYQCGSTLCSAGNVNTGGNGLLWAK